MLGRVQEGKQRWGKWVNAYKVGLDRSKFLWVVALAENVDKIYIQIFRRKDVDKFHHGKMVSLCRHRCFNPALNIL